VTPEEPVRRPAGSAVPEAAGERLKKDRSVIIRDLVIFQVKLLLDGLKDIVLSPLAVIAAGLDLIAPTSSRGRRFYMVLSVGERFDRWLSLFSVSEKASTHEEGLFGASRAGANTMLGKLEEMVLGRKEEPLLDESAEEEAGER